MAKPCPICGAKPSKRDNPFCSPHCASVDLGRWFSGQYVVPSTEIPDSDEIERHEDGEGGDDEKESAQVMPFPRREK